MPSSIYQNVRTDRQYKAATGLSITEFDLLYENFKGFYTPKEQSPHFATEPVLLADRRAALFFILHYLKAYPTLQNMGLYFGMSDAAVSTFLMLLKPCLKAALQQQGNMAQRVFASQQAFDAAFAGVTDIFIDVTEIPIERAVNQDEQRDHFSGKKTSTRSTASSLAAN